MKKHTISVILPIFNEDSLITTSIDEVVKKMQKLFDIFEVVAVNDGSTDTSLKLLKQAKKKHPQLVLVNHKTNRGYGAALRSGIKAAKFDWIFFTDADLQFNLNELKKLKTKMNSHDFIVGYRKNRADSTRRKIISSYYNKLIKLLFGLQLVDVDCAFKLMKKSSLKSVNFSSDSFFVSVELMVKAFKQNFRITEFGVQHYPRLGGKSKVTFQKIINTITDLLRLYGELK